MNKENKLIKEIMDLYRKRKESHDPVKIRQYLNQKNKKIDELNELVRRKKDGKLK